MQFTQNKNLLKLSTPLTELSDVSLAKPSSLTIDNNEPSISNSYMKMPTSNETYTDNNNISLPIPPSEPIISFSNVSICSRIFFTWTRIAMRISNKVSLKVTHLLSYMKLQITRNDLSFLKDVWYGNLHTGRAGYFNYKYCPLLLAIMRANLLTLLSLFIITFANTGLKFVQIYFLRQLILVYKHIADPIGTKEPSFSLIPSVIYFLTAKSIYIIVNYNIKYFENMIGRKTSNQIASLIYEKTMNLSSSARLKYSEGEIMNFIQIDADSLGPFFYDFAKIIVFPFQFGMYMYMLFNFFGMSFTFGFALFCVLMTISFMVQKMYVKSQFTYLQHKDSRMKLTSQTFHMLKVLKLYAWENEFEGRINKCREIELHSMKKILNLKVISQFIHWSIPLVLSIVSVGVYTYTSGEVLDFANLMTSIDIFDSMSGPLYRLPVFITSILNAYISMNRISAFLHMKDHKKQHTSNASSTVSISINNCSFGCNNKTLLHNINLTINKGELIAVLGETASGKSCLIHTLMGLMEKIGNNAHIVDNFIINGKIAFASQTPWIMNETIRNNILFQNEYDDVKYKKVIELCQLEKDINTFPGGDLTEIGANGTNISGGQKARISLARCVYRESDIYLFDDPISAVDAYVSNEIFTKLFDEYLRGKTRVVVTNDIRNLHLCDRIIFVDKGNIVFNGKYNEIKQKDFYNELLLSNAHNRNTYNNNNNNNTSSSSANNDTNANVNSRSNENTSHISHSLTESNIDNDETTSSLLAAPSSSSTTQPISSQELIAKSRLTKDEDQAQGGVGLVVYMKFVAYIGGCIFMIILVILAIGWQLSNASTNVWLAKWTSETNPDNLYYFLIYTEISFVSIFCLFLKDFLVSRAILNTNKTLHDKMLHPLIKAPINLFHDTIPIGQILNRLTLDLEIAKKAIEVFASFLKSNCKLIAAIIVCCRYNIYCLILSPILLCIGLLMSRYYVNAGRDLNRLNGIARSPILSLYSETIIGMNIIKAFNVEKHFTERFFDKLDDYYTVVNYRYGAETWFSMHLELLTIAYIFFILIYAVLFKHSFTAQAIGLLIKYSVSFSEEMLGVLDYIIEFERSLVAIERCDTYTKVIQEKPDIITNENEARLKEINWPYAGDIQFKKVNIRYRPGIDLTLKDVDIHIKPKEKIGIVGRTGSGKSTLSLALFRIVEMEQGKIIIDDIDISKIGLKSLRSKLTIVPQDPTIFEGNLRYNLDPMHIYKDNEIQDAIEKVSLFKLMKENGRDVSKGLQMKIKDCGSNLSLGEKQLICFARAILRKSTVVLLDEATASVDHKTEQMIQDVIDNVFEDCTLITIAHRLQTVKKCDKVIVMDNGRVVEFDTVDNLLHKENGMFKLLYQRNNKLT